MGDYIKNMVKRMSDFRSENECCDVNIKVEDEIFPCQKVVLCASSEYFEKMFLGDFKESVEKVVSLNSISKLTFSDVLDFVYTGEIILNTATVTKILSAAMYMVIDCLAEKCTTFIKEKTTIHNAVQFFLESIELKLEDIEQFLQDFIRNHLDVIVKDDKLFHTPYPHFLALTSKNRNKYTLDAIMMWVASNLEERTQHIGALLDGMRLQFFNSVNFIWPTVYTFFLEYSYKLQASLDVKFSNSMVQIKTVLDNLSASSDHFDIQIFAIHKEMENILSMSYKEGAALKPISYMEDVLAAESFSVTKLKYFTYVLGSFNNELSLNMYDNVFGKKWVPLQAPSTYCHKLITYDRGDCIYGYPGKYGEYDECYELYNYIPEIDKWFRLAFPSNISKDAELVTYNGIIYFIGDVYKTFDPRSGVWSDMVTKPELDCIGASAAAVLNNRIYVSGGWDTKLRSGVLSFDIVAGKWDSARDMNYAREWHSLISHNQKLYAIGGNPIIEVYDPKVDVWETDVNIEESWENVYAVV